MLAVSGRALGRKKPIFDDFSVPLPDAIEAGKPATLRELLGHVVRAEVAAFKDRQAERRILKALTDREIAAGLAAGKVQMGGSDLDQAVDPEAAVAAVIEAFSDGLFLVLLDEAEVKELDGELNLTASSRLTFIRLALLAGG